MRLPSVRLAEIDFTTIGLNERTILLRPGEQLDDPLALPLLGQHLQQLTVPGMCDVIATTTELCLVLEGDPAAMLRNVGDLDLPGLEVASRTIHLPVCFDTDREAGDWREVERQAGLPREDYIAQLCELELTVAMFGFLPGFTYLAGIPAHLQCRRKANPVPQVSAGSVALGGPYAGIYSLSSPGGWQVIGRIPETLADLTRTPPLRLQIGDRVRFQPIPRQDFEHA